MEFWGQLAGLSTAVAWAFTSIFFAKAGRLIGSFKVNSIRLLMATGIYVVILLLTTGRLFPEDLNRTQFLWLAASGLIGLVFGDGCGFKAMVMIGPRLLTLLHASAPIMAVIIAWFWLGEILSVWDILAIVITMSGITWVVSERRYNNNPVAVEKGHPDSGTMFKGVLLGLGAAFGQAAGLVMSKQAMVNAGGDLPPMESSFIRILVSFVFIWGLAAVRGQLGEFVKAMRNKAAMGNTFGGAVFGPFFGVWMSLAAVKFISTGVAATLNSMTPVMIIPIVIFYMKEKVSLRATIGAIIAVLGVALIFLV
jgi:drug/metabolite transporter (DMT)-like permease